METYEKIKMMREMNQWTQEEVAEKLGMSTTGYAKIERGQTNVSVEKLKQIAQIFNINIAQLLDDNEKLVICSIGDNHSNYNNYFGMNEKLIAQNEKQQLEIQLKDELLKQKDAEITALKELIELLKGTK
ncbi:XRE family transcriptional regulator [Actinobacillus porcitonsillarum]|uniref:XRE family transcriptional regulator n=1 Tax=Actinobacillus porcitonsillarum TaxID=189834 RepID=A0A2U8FJ45_9PAST|nr:helix-turn-helix transcriptional regulator [Actinobacillus porcitonsillarum]AWI50988.1 XRE family transcriptional regulator [Actinobacillus porcitonsillarum]